MHSAHSPPHTHKPPQTSHTPPITPPFIPNPTITHTALTTNHAIITMPLRYRQDWQSQSTTYPVHMHIIYKLTYLSLKPAKADMLAFPLDHLAISKAYFENTIFQMHSNCIWIRSWSQNAHYYSCGEFVNNSVTVTVWVSVVTYHQVQLPHRLLL